MHTLNSSSPKLPSGKGPQEDSSLSKSVQALPSSRNEGQQCWRPPQLRQLSTRDWPAAINSSCTGWQAAIKVMNLNEIRVCSLALDDRTSILRLKITILTRPDIHRGQSNQIVPKSRQDNPDSAFPRQLRARQTVREEWSKQSASQRREKEHNTLGAASFYTGGQAGQI